MTSTARGSSTGIGELALIDAIGAALERRPGSRVLRWLGDDAAVVRAGALAVTSVDAMVEGTHFNLGPRCGPEDVGHRALAGALSDLAAMGAGPGGRAAGPGGDGRRARRGLPGGRAPARARPRRGARPAPRGGGARARD